MKLYCVVGSCVLFLISACTPLAPIQSGTSAAVMFEDLTEDPAQDAQEQSLLEGIDDIFSGPMNMLKAGIVANVAFFWSLGDLLVGNDVDFNKRAATMSQYFPLTLSSPSVAPRQLTPSEMPGSPFAMNRSSSTPMPSPPPPRIVVREKNCHYPKESPFRSPDCDIPFALRK